MNNTYDIVVIGAGIAGASVAAHLAASRTVCILEMEDRPGYHTTGRSAASFEPNYGPKPMLALTRASASFFKDTPQGFSDSPIFTPRGSIFFEPEEQQEYTTKLLIKSHALHELSESEARKIYPVLREGYAKRS